jgi:hypothetical protein
MCYDQFCNTSKLFIYIRRNISHQTKHYHNIYRNLYYHISVVGIATAYGLDGRGSNPGGGEIFRTCQTGPEAQAVSCTMGTGSFPGVRCGRDVTLTPHPLLVPR